MKRRDFSRASALALASAGMPSTTLFAQALPPRIGVDYLSLEPAVSVQTLGSRIEVVEFFWYSCPHCNAFEPVLEAWVSRLPKDVVLRRVPAGFRVDMVPQQRLFYTLELMGLLPVLHAKIFRAIHQEKQALDREAAIVNWVTSQGVDRIRFVEQFTTLAVSLLASQATQSLNAYKVEGVPALGVAGRFYTDGELARSMSRALQITDHLIAEVRRGMA